MWKNLLLSSVMKSLCFPRYTTHLSDAQINEKISELNRYCVTSLPDRQSVDLKNDKELELFSEILERSSVSLLQSQNLTGLINCAVKIVAKYSHFHVPNAELTDKKQSDKYHVAKENYVKLLNIYPNDKQEELPVIVITAINSQNIWLLRKLCVKLILSLIELGIPGPLVYHQLCNQIKIPETSTNEDAKLIVKVLYESLENYKWPENNETAIFIERLLNIYHKSLKGTSRKTKAMAYTNLRACLELCVRYLIRNITNNHRKLAIELMSSWSIKKDVDDDFILNYGSTLEYAAYMHQGNTLTDTLTADILALLMLMIGSKIRFVSLLGNRVFQYLIDSGKNQTMFNTPKIFFQGMQINMTPCKYFRDDQTLLKKHRAIIHDSLIRSFINHRSTRLNVETTYCTVCLLIIAIPCGFTAAAMCCLVMNLQEVALNRLTEIERKDVYHLHAIIISVLTFVCWIHEAKDFHEYVNNIVMERAQWAPHLNPPLQSHYNSAAHHVLWDKPELFPVDWEVRFGLWQRFRLNLSANTKAKKVSYVDT